MTHPYTRLVSRYGRDQGLYLYGEWCLLQTLGIEAFRARHTPMQLAVLAAQLEPLALWPAGMDPAPDASPDDGTPGAADPLTEVAHDLAAEPLRLVCGPDLYFAIAEWASAGGVTPGAWFEPSRAALTEQLGFIPPPLGGTLDPSLPPTGYRLTIWREVVLEGEVHPGQDLVINPPDAPPPPLPYAWTSDPAGPGLVAWMPVGPASEPPAELPRVHWLVALDRHLTAALPAWADRLVTTGVVQSLLAEAERAGYDHELERYVSVPELRLVFRELLRQGLPLKPIAPMLEAMLHAILTELAGRPLTPPELERLGRQLPVFPTAKLVALVRKAQGLPPEEPIADVRKLRALTRDDGRRREVAAPVPADVATGWRALAGRVEATRGDAASLAAALRRAEVARGLSPWTALHHGGPGQAAAHDERVRLAAARIAAEAAAYAGAWEAWRGWCRAADAVRRVQPALDGRAPWPPGLPAASDPSWRWSLGRPGALLAAFAG